MKTSERRPSADDPRTWHIHDDDTWAWDVICPACEADTSWYKRGPLSDMRYIHFEERTGVSVQQFKREMFDQARAEGTEISKA